jgi:uncharacterized repeat protein (TIGR01451 family)
MENRVTFTHKLFSLLVVLAAVALSLSPVTPAHRVQAADSGWRSPNANAADVSGDGNGFEESPAAAYADGGGYARNWNGAGDGHLYYGFGYDPSLIPAGAVVTGIEVRLDGWADSPFNDPRYDVQLSWDGGTSWSSTRSTANLAASGSTFYVGNQDDLWGRTWAASELSDANFRVRITSIASAVPGSNGALDFDGANDYVAATAVPGTGPLTVEAWVRPDASNANGLLVVNSSGDDGWSLEINGGRLNFWLFTSQGWQSVQHPTNLAGGQWYHVAGTYANNQARTFVNGVASSSVTVGNRTQGEALRFGGMGSFSYFGGTIDEVRISNVARYTASFAVATTPFVSDADTVGLWSLDEGSGQFASDESSSANTGRLGSTNGTDASDPAWVAGYPFPDAQPDNRDFFLDWVAVRVFYALARINGTVWADDDANGVQDDGETGLGGLGVAVYLDDGDGVFEGGGQDTEAGSATTDAGGNYSVGPLMDGYSYWVDVDAPAGRYLTTPPEPRLVALIDSSPITASFGYAPVASASPAIEVAKAPDTQTIVSGSTVTFTISVTNTGNVPLASVAVSDPQAPDCARSLDSLSPGAYTSYQCTLGNVSADLTNTATASGQPPVGGAVTDADTAFVDVIRPSIEIAKQPRTQTILSGSSATFTVAVTNTGDAPLASVAVSDPQVTDCTRSLGTLGPGASADYPCSLDNMTADLTNTVTVAGIPPAGDVVTGTDTAFVAVVNPAIEVAKTPDTQVVTSGSTVTFTIFVTNTGNARLVPVTVYDPQAPSCSRTIARLNARNSTSYPCTMANVTADVTNTVVVSGTSPAGIIVTDNDTAFVDVVRPAIEIAKTPDTQTVLSGSTVTFAITVTNSGDVPLAAVTVSDPQAPDCARSLGTLNPGGQGSYLCTLANVSADLTNTAAVSGSPPAGAAVTASDTAFVGVIRPAIEIAKTPDRQWVSRGSPATFTIAVTNTGDVPLTSVAVADPRVPACARTIGTLSPGAWTSYPCTVGEVTENLTNEATVSGTPPLGGPVTDTDTAVVALLETQDCSSDMVGYWRLDEGSGPSYEDFYGARDGQCAGTCPAAASGHVSGGQAFGSGTGIDVPADPAFDWGAAASFSVELWMQTDSTSTCAGNQVMIGRDDSSTQLHWWVGCFDGGQAAFVLIDTSGHGDWVTGTSDLTDGAWHHLVAVREASSSQIRIYVDGTLQTSTPVSYAQGFGSPTAALNVGWLNLPAQYHFQGTLDEVALYSQALSPQQVRQHYNEGLAGRWYCQARPFAPVIVSSAPTRAGAELPYTYDVEAAGDPSPAYTLLTYPAGMTIDPATGLIAWTPTAAQLGDHPVEVRASNTQGADTQRFTVTVSFRYYLPIVARKQ